MIVRQRDQQLLLITQPDHAQMAGRVMEHCARLLTHPRRSSILRACREHDGGWIEVDAEPAVNPTTRRPFDFMTSPVVVRQGVWPRAIARLRDDPWAAALVAHHAVTVYDRFRSDPEWTGFFASMGARRDELVRDQGLTHDEVLTDYPFVRLADLISLTFCVGWTDEMRIDPWSVRGRGAHVIVTPEAFDGRPVSFEVDCRLIPDRDYRSDDELRSAVAQTTRLRLAGTVAGA